MSCMCIEREYICICISSVCFISLSYYTCMLLYNIKTSGQIFLFLSLLVNAHTIYTDICPSFSYLSVVSFSTFTSEALVSSDFDPSRLQIAPGVQIDQFKSLFTYESSITDGVSLDLSSYIHGGITIQTSASIAGTYVCRANNSFGTRESIVDISVLEGTGMSPYHSIGNESISLFLLLLDSIDDTVPSTTHYIRLSFEESSIDVVDTEYQLAAFESDVCIVKICTCIVLNDAL